jgi:FtsP/CotA-like multicopper oxidase with cupredoxin domain
MQMEPQWASPPPFTWDQAGLSLMHCHQQIHMDYGLMTLLNTV